MLKLEISNAETGDFDFVLVSSYFLRDCPRKGNSAVNSRESHLSELVSCVFR